MQKNYMMKFGDIGRSIFYRAACRCVSQECDLTLELESDNIVTAELFILVALLPALSTAINSQ